MPPVKKYTQALPPAPCKEETKKALETAADVISEKIGRTVKPAALLRQIVIDWLSRYDFVTDEADETEELKKFQAEVAKIDSMSN
jgi:hypothetical protein